MNVEENDGGGTGPHSAGSAELLAADAAHVALSALATAVAPPAPARVLVAHGSRERSSRRGAVGGDASVSFPLSTALPAAHAATGKFHVNQVVKLVGLVSRPDLVGASASILSHESASGRYAVTVDSTSENVRVKEVNLEAFI